MERLTERSLGYCTQMCPDEKMFSCAFYKDDQAERCLIANMYDRLAAYEETNLSPDDIREAFSLIRYAADLVNGNISYNHLRKILAADQEGRLVVLPCKVGDTVYTFYNGKNCKWPTNMKRGKIYETLVSGIRLHDWDADDWRLLLLFDTREASGCYEFSFSEVGKTVFLTREEAEKALEGVGEDD